MNILAPINDIKDILDFDAEELYLGFYDEEFNKLFGKYANLNRMTNFHQKANKYSFNEVLDLITLAHENNKRIFITFNGEVYSDEMLLYIRKYFVILKDYDVDGVITADLGITKLALEYNLKPVISTIAGIYNSDILNFYKELGVKRVILPRDLTIDEISRIVSKHPDMEYEVFFMRNGCRFSDSHCLGLHASSQKSLCAHLKDLPMSTSFFDYNFLDIHDFEVNNHIYNHYFHNYACGLCALYIFLKLNICSLKIVGRYEDRNSIKEEINLIKENIIIAKNSNSNKEFLDHMMFPKFSYKSCKMGLGCYYPEIRFK